MHDSPALTANLSRRCNRVARRLRVCVTLDVLGVGTLDLVGGLDAALARAFADRSAVHVLLLGSGEVLAASSPGTTLAVPEGAVCPLADTVSDRLVT